MSSLGKRWKLSKEARENMSIARLGNKNSLGRILSDKTKKKISEARKGQTSAFKRHKHSKESIRIMSEKAKLRLGNKNSNWRGGIYPENKKIRASIEYRLWREAVFARDNWTCQKCGQRGGELNAHHIKGFAQYPKLRVAIDNGMTLCKRCHRKTYK